MCCNDYQHKSLCVDIYFHFAWKVCRSRIAESCGKFVFSFLRKCLIIFQSDFTICISTNNGWVFQFLHILTNTVIVFLYQSFQFCSVIQSCPIFFDPWTAVHQASLSIINSQSLLKLIFIRDAINRLILCHPLLLPPSIIPSIRVFASESVLHIRWPKYWSFSFSISPSNGYSRLILFRSDWFDLLAAQGTFKSLLQHHSSITSILWCSAFFIVQLLHPYMTAEKTIALTRQTFFGKVISDF